MNGGDFWAIIGKERYSIRLDEGELLYANADVHPPLYIYQDERFRWLHFGSNAVQSVMALGKDSHQLVLPYAIFLHAFLLFKASISSALIVGSGGGSIGRFLRHHFDEAAIYAIESNRLVVQQAKTFFNVSDAVFQMNVADACSVAFGDIVTSSDVVIVDLFDADKIPACLYSAEFYCQCANVLDDDGVLAANVVVDSAEAFTKILATIRSQFQQNTLCVPVPDHKNIIILAFKRKPMDLSLSALYDRAASLSPRFNLDLATTVDEMAKVNPKNGDVFIM